jgi:glucose-1-phosphate thymidylyltransferase
VKTKGLLLAGGKGTRLAPITSVVNKHLLPIYDKPMIYYPLSTLMLSGLREIALITNPGDVSTFQKLLGDGSQFGIELTYLIQDNPNGLPEAFIIAEEFLNGANSVLALGDNLLIGQGFGRILGENINKEGASVFAFPVKNPSEYGVVEFNSAGKVISLEEKPLNPKSRYVIPGLYFMDSRASAFSKDLQPSQRGELEITDLLNLYRKIDSLHVTALERGTGWLDTGTTESLFAASELVRVLQERQGYRISMPEEVALNNGWITSRDLLKIAGAFSSTSYGKYLIEIAETKNNQSNY